MLWVTAIRMHLSINRGLKEPPCPKWSSGGIRDRVETIDFAEKMTWRVGDPVFSGIGGSEYWENERQPWNS